MQKRPNLLNSFFLLTHMWVNNYTVIVDYIVKCTTSSSLLQYTFEKIKCMHGHDVQEVLYLYCEIHDPWERNSGLG